MGTRRRLISIGVLLASVVLVTSCKRKEPPPPKDEKPPDHLAPNEVVEGKDRAFGLPLPRVAEIAARFEKTVHVKTPLAPEDLTNFVRARVKDGKVTPGSGSTQLSDVIPRDDPQKRLTIDVRTLRAGNGMRSEMIVRDTTPMPAEPGLTDEQRWNKAGVTSDGKLVDPKHLQ